MRKLITAFFIFYTSLIAKPTIFNTPKEALENFGEYVEKGDKNHVTTFVVFAGEKPEVMEFFVKRAIVKGFLISFINTKANEATLTVNIRKFPNQDFVKQAFRGTIKRKDILKVAKKLLHINSLDKLVGSTVTINGQTITMNDSPNKLFNQITYNDQGGVTLDVFYKELKKYIK